MADEQDLDDFFAKKDKKVGKKKGKIANVKLAKKLEGAKDTEKKEKKKKEKLEPSVTEQDNPEETQKDEKDEWLPFEEEAEVDLTGLKIQKLEISESGNDDDDNQGSGEERTEGQDENNPWKVAQQQQQQQQVERPPTPEPEPEEKPEPVPAPEPQAKGPSSYVPPHMRHQQQQSQQSGLKPKILGRGGRMKKAPDITNQESFPSLECATQEAPPSTVGPWGRKIEPGFESVRHGSRTSADSQESRGPKLNLGNMYSALQDS